MSRPPSISPPAATVPVLATGQSSCHALDGAAIACHGTGQDAEYSLGSAWPSPRFEEQGEAVHDRLTGLTWSRSACPAEFPLTWAESLDVVDRLNSEQYCGQNNWRLPNRRELHSLISFDTSRPALPAGHPFSGVFLGWYWSSSTFAHDNGYAWRVHMEGGRMFYGKKDEYSLLWPVCGESPCLPVTGQSECHDPLGRDVQHGLPLPLPRFTSQGDTVLDNLTGLRWLRNANMLGPVDWKDIPMALAGLQAEVTGHRWRMPNIRELECLTDTSASFPALGTGHPFSNTGDGYWSSTASSFAYDWCMVLYLGKGAVGVGYKRGTPFLMWPVCDDDSA